MRLFFLLLSAVVLIKAATLGVDEHPGAMVPKDLTFITSEGKKITLGEMMDNKPTIVTFNYYRCAGICTPQLVELAKVLSKVDLKEGKDYRVVTIDIADDESVELAANKKKNILKAALRPYDPKAWFFTVTDGNNSAKLAKVVGFNYEKKVLPSGATSYVHGASAIVLSPEGKITRYLNGVNQLPFDLKMALLEASQGRVGPTIAKTLLFCFSYDPKGRTYVFKWEKIAGIVLTLLMVLFFVYLIRSSQKQRKAMEAQFKQNQKGE